MVKGFYFTRLAFLLVGLLSTSALGAQVSPTPETQVDHGGTLAVGTAVTVLSNGSAVAGYRVDCLLQNTSGHTIYYSFTGAATTASKQLLAGNSMNCLDGVSVSTAALSILGTIGDTYALTESFVGAQ